MRKIIDISLPVSASLPVWPGDPPVWKERIQKMEQGDDANVTALRFGAHTGTHMDAPYHFIENGRTIDEIAPHEMIGTVQVVQIDDKIDLITVDVIEHLHIDPAIQKILFKTRNSHLWAEHQKEFDTGYVGIDESAANRLVEMGIRLLGVDYLSVAPYENQTPVHQTLLGAKIILLEGLNLSEVTPGIYELVCLPLKLAGADGAPARAVLFQEE